MGRKAKATKAERQDVYRRYLIGKRNGVAAMAREYGVSVSTIQNWIYAEKHELKILHFRRKASGAA